MKIFVVANKANSQPKLFEALTHSINDFNTTTGSTSAANDNPNTEKLETRNYLELLTYGRIKQITIPPF